MHADLRSQSGVHTIDGNMGADEDDDKAGRHMIGH